MTSNWLLFVSRCKPSRPKGARERNKEICKLIMGLTYDENTRSMFVNNLKAKMAEYNLETVYLASPPNVSFFLIYPAERADGQMNVVPLSRRRAHTPRWIIKISYINNNFRISILFVCWIRPSQGISFIWTMSWNSQTKLWDQNSWTITIKHLLLNKKLVLVSEIYDNIVMLRNRKQWRNNIFQDHNFIWEHLFRLGHKLSWPIVWPEITRNMILC